MLRVTRLGLVGAVTLPLLVTACGGTGSEGLTRPTPAPGLTTPAPAATNTSAEQEPSPACTPPAGGATQPLPPDVPEPAAGTQYQYSEQGATKVWFFAIVGDRTELRSLRDAYDTTLRSKGYEIEGTDAEEEAEAESEFRGPHAGTTNWRPLCDGLVVLRLKLTS